MADQGVILATAVSARKRTLIELLSAETTRQTGFTHRFRIPFDVLNNASWTTQGDTVTVTLGSTPGFWIVDKAAAVVTTAFATTGTLTLQVGTDGDQDNFIDAQSCKTTGVCLGAAGAVPVTEAGSFDKVSDVLVARFTTQSATGAPSNITDGEVEIFLGIRDLTDVMGS